MPVGPYLLTIPVEIIEYILTLLAVDGEPHAIAALAAACRLLYNMVYESPDSHLWREIFLTTFDDPRPTRRIAYGRVYIMPFNHINRTDDVHLHLQKKSPSTGAQSTDVAFGPRDTSGHFQSIQDALQTSGSEQRTPYHPTTTPPTFPITRSTRTSAHSTQYSQHSTQQRCFPRHLICSPRARWCPSPGCSHMTSMQDWTLAPAPAPAPSHQR